MALMSPNGTWRKPGSSGINGLRKVDFAVADSAPRDLPWNAPLVAIKVNFPRGDWYALASLIAASTDSVPLLLKKLYFSLPGVKAASVFASMARSGSSSSWLWRGCFAS
jgi:hypothetical protein